MKTTLSFLLLTFCHLTYAQTYVPFPDSACWTYGLSCFESTTQLNITMYGDTVIDGNTYKRLSAEESWIFVDYPYSAYYTNSYPYIGALRQDSLKNIWFRSCCPNILINPGSYCNFSDSLIVTDQDILIYKFGSEVGDTLPINNPNTGEPLIVTAIDSVDSYTSFDGYNTDFGSYRKRYTVKGLNYLVYNTDFTQLEDKSYWVEGIGSLENLLVVFFPGSVQSDPYFDRWYLTAFASGDCYLGVNEQIENTQISSSPNPTTDRLQYQYQGEYTPNLSVAVYNLQGMLINLQQAKNINTFNYTFDLSDQPAGIYLIQTVTNKGSHAQKIIKH